MRLLIGLVVALGSLFGIAMVFLSSITVDSSLDFFNGMNMSIVLGLFFVASFLAGIFALFSGGDY
jgi:hypothetical protein